jgi:hypothetical protein
MKRKKAIYASQMKRKSIKPALGQTVRATPAAHAHTNQGDQQTSMKWGLADLPTASASRNT